MRKTISIIVWLMVMSLTLSLPLSVLAATLSFNANTTILLPNSRSVTLLDTGRLESLVINDDSTLTVGTGSDTDFVLRSTNRYDFTTSNVSGTPSLGEICDVSLGYSQLSFSGATSTVTVTVTGTVACGSDTSSSSTTSAGSSGGGGGGGGDTTASSGTTIGIGESASVGSVTTSGKTLNMYQGSQANFSSVVSTGVSENHSAKITKVDLTSQSVTLTIQSNPVTITLAVGQSQSVDLDGDGKNDMSVKLKSLVVNKTELTFTSLYTSVARSGELIKLQCAANAGLNDPCRAVYYVGNNGKRYVFPNIKTYNTWYSDFSTVKIVTSDELAKYPIGGNATYRPGVKLVKITTDPKVYAVASNGALRWVTTAAIAQELYGANWGGQIEDVPDAFFVNYRTGIDIGAAVAYSKTGAMDVSPNINTDKGL